MGLLFGMYSSAGIYTCAQYGMQALMPLDAKVITLRCSVAGSLGKEKEDADTFASWGVGKFSI